MSYYIHNVPGRLRIKSPAIKKNGDAAYEIKKILGTIHGVATVDINLITGSILINYNPQTTNYKDVLSILQTKGYFDISKAVTNDEYIHAAASKAGQVIGKTIFGAFVGIALDDSPLSFMTVLI